MELPYEILVMICAAVYDDTSPGYHSPYHSRACREMTPEVIKTLQDLRLTTKIFYNAASSFLFRHITSTHNHIQSLQNLFDLSESSHASHVKELHIEVKNAYSKRTGPETKAYLEELVAVLPICVRNCASILRLVIVAPRKQCPSENFRVQFLKVVENLFRYSRLDSLEDLCLQLPLADDFECLATTPAWPGSPFLPQQLTKVMNNVRHLELAIQDGANLPGGISDSLAMYPNHQHLRGLSTLLSKTTQLKSLSIECANLLDFEFLDYSSFSTLELFEIEAQFVSHKNLCLLFKNTLTSLSCIDLRCIDLKTGTWKEVLEQIERLLRLTTFRISLCGYDPDGESSHLCASDEQIELEEDRPLNYIQSIYEPDFEAMKKVVIHVMRNRTAAGPPAMPKDKYDYIISLPDIS